MAHAVSLIPATVHRNLSDELYEKRKLAALELENIVKNLISSGDHEKILKIIEVLTNEFAKSFQVNQRKGGLLGLSAVTLGLSSEAAQYLEQIVPSVIDSFTDQDSEVRFYTCEALYNIAKVVRDDFIIFFNQIFDALCKLSADSDAKVQRAAHLLDNVVKEIVTESDQFSIEEFIPLLKERMNVINPRARQFLLGWIIVLDSAPNIDMLAFLPYFLNGLFNMLSDSSPEIRQQAYSALSEFLEEIRNSSSVDYGTMAKILVHNAASPDEFTRLTAITWINEFVKLGGDQLVRYCADILGAILPCISDEDEKIRVVARETSEELRSVHVEPLDVGAVLSVARRQLSSNHEATLIEALNWISTLLNKHPTQPLCFRNDIFDTLLKALSDSSDDVVVLVLEIYASVAIDPHRFRQLIVFLVRNFQADISLLERRGALIVRRLCVLLDAKRVYRELSSILEGEDNLDFASTMVQALNLILLTSPELSKLRDLLKGSLVNREGNELFVTLYTSWSHSPIAIISLCLLAQAYQHASDVIQSFGEEDINVKFLVQLDKLIRLLETPIFTYLRLQLLEPGRYTWLMKTLYGLLMLLPQQSAAFKILRTRLKTVPMYSFSRGDEVNINSSHQGINFAARLQQFENVQKQHGHERTKVNNSYSRRGNGSYQDISSSDMSFLNDSSCSTLTCQICGKYGHSAVTCYKRFDNICQSEELPTALAAIRISDQTITSGQDRFSATGASAHITNSLSQLQSSQVYNGDDSVMVQNGQMDKTG